MDQSALQFRLGLHVPIQLPDDFFDQLEDLRQSAFDEDSDIRKDVQHMVDTYHYDENTTHGIKNKG